jgi:DNA-binding MarR family transcriptional regulator
MKEPTEQNDLAVRCTDLVRRLADLTRVPDSEWLALDIGMGQLKALIVLKEQGRQTVGGLARALRVTEPSASLLLDRLVIRGLVARESDSEDRRRTLVALSASGDELMTRLRRTKDDRFIAWLSRVSAEDLQSLERGLGALHSVIAGEGSPEVAASRSPQPDTGEASSEAAGSRSQKAAPGADPAGGRP